MNYLADTHALVWHFTNSTRLSPRAAEIFSACECGECMIFIPSIVIAEALSIFEKKKVVFDFRRLFKKIRESENFALISLDYYVLQKMVDLRDVPELHDKIIAATAIHLDAAIITRDEVLRTAGHIETVW